MRIFLRLACMGWITCLAADPKPEPPLIDPNEQHLQWRTHRSNDDTCVFSGTAVSELRDDAFEVQFRQSRGQEIKLFVLIPRLQGGGTVFMESPTTRDRWKLFTESYRPAVAGSQAETLRRNVAAGIPLKFTFDYGKGKPVIFETVAKGSINAALQFTTCLNEVAQDALQAESKKGKK